MDELMKELAEELIGDYAIAATKMIADDRIKHVAVDASKLRDVVALAVKTYTDKLAALRNDEDTKTNDANATELEKAIAEAKLKAYETCDKEFFTCVLAAVLTLMLEGEVKLK